MKYTIAAYLITLVTLCIFMIKVWRQSVKVKRKFDQWQKLNSEPGT